MADLGYANIWKTNLAPAPTLTKLVCHRHSDICPLCMLSSPHQLIGSERVLSHVIGADKNLRGRKIGVRTSCSVRLLYALHVAVECAILFSMLKWALPDFDIDFLPHCLANFAEAC